MRPTLRGPLAFVASGPPRYRNAFRPPGCDVVALPRCTPSPSPSSLLSVPASSAAAATATIPPLGPSQLASSLSTVLLVATALRAMGLTSQSWRILKAAARMSGQLTITGAFLLTPLFLFAASSPWVVAPWIVLVAVVASREARSRSGYRYDGQMGDCFAAMLGGVGLTLAHLVALVLRAPFSASKARVDARTIVPIAGMLFGNALSATTLGMSVLLKNFVEGRDQVELRLSRGANVREAALPAVREAVEAALMPTVNAMAATGLIFMPGMMTGQILGGQSPSAAAAYQIMIYFAIASSSCLTAMLLSGIVAARMFDLHRQALVPWRSIPGLAKSEKSKSNIDEASRSEQWSDPESGPKPKLRVRVGASGLSGGGFEPLLRVRNLSVESTNMTLPLLEVRTGDRVGISGRSGIGKTRLLRAIAGLDPASSDVLSLGGRSRGDMSPAEWRSQVMWVSQDRPTASGTPRELYEEMTRYRSRRDEEGSPTPMEMARGWDLPPDAWDGKWGDASGGEAQRMSLAIALALGPRVLLLDEPTSSCDRVTESSIEATMIKRGVTVLMVSHSKEQLNRFCTSTIELTS